MVTIGFVSSVMVTKLMI